MSAGMPQQAHGGTSLAMLVQQRELQNSKKLEALVAKNEELTQANLHAEQEREALLERLTDIDARLSDAASVIASLSQAGEQATQGQSSRLAYLEQGVEERFSLLEEDVKTLQDTLAATAQVREERDLDMEMVEKLIVDAMAHAAQTSNDKIAALETQVIAKDDTITSLQAQIEAVAQWVGGFALQEELRAVQTDHMRNIAETESRVQSHVDGTKQSVARQLQALGDKLIHTDKTAATAAATAQKRAEQGAASINERITSLEVALGAKGDEIRHCREEVAALGEGVGRAVQRDTGAEEGVARAEGSLRAVDGRLNTVESTLCQLQTKLIESVEGSVEARLRTERLEITVGEHTASIASTAADTREAEVKAKLLKEELAAVEGNNERRHANLEEMLTTVINDLSVIDEKRRQREKDDTQSSHRLAEMTRMDIQEIRRDIELLKDSTPSGVEEPRLASLMQQLEGAKEALETALSREAERGPPPSVPPQVERRHLQSVSTEKELLFPQQQQQHQQHQQQTTLFPQQHHEARLEAAPAPAAPVAAAPEAGAADTGKNDMFFIERAGSLERRLEALEEAFEITDADRPASGGAAPASARDAEGGGPTMSPVRARAPGPGGDAAVVGAVGSVAAAQAPRLVSEERFESRSRQVVQDRGITGERGGTPPPPMLQNVQASHNRARVVVQQQQQLGHQGQTSPVSSVASVSPGRQRPLRPVVVSTTSVSEVHRAPGMLGGDEFDPAGDARSAFEREFDVEYHHALEAGRLGSRSPVVSFRPQQAPQVPPLSLVQPVGPETPRGGDGQVAQHPAHAGSAIADLKQSMEEKLTRSRELTAERRRLESELEKVNQHLSFNQMAFQTVADKEGALGLRSPFFASLEDGSAKADEVKQRLHHVVEELKKSKHNLYERERLLVEEGGKLRKKIGSLREAEKALSEELQKLQRVLASHVSVQQRPLGIGTPGGAPPPYGVQSRHDSPTRSRGAGASRSMSPAHTPLM